MTRPRLSIYTVAMTPGLIGIITVGVALAGLIISGQRSLRADLSELRKEVNELRKEVNGLRERMAHLEGLLEGLREALTGRRAA